MNDIYFVTSNDNKLKEFKEILGMDNIKRIDFELLEIQAVNVEDVAKEKILYAYQKIGKPVFAEDSGLYLEELNGLPGALIRSFLERLSLEQFSNLVKGDRRATAKTCLAYCPDGEEVLFFIGEIHGRINLIPLGSNGFGWDSIFIPDGENETFGQMSKEKKNSISMRNIACLKFKE
jgi:XTP/dITP diphosphohydrolase